MCVCGVCGGVLCVRDEWCVYGVCVVKYAWCMRVVFCVVCVVYVCVFCGCVWCV